MHDAFDIGAWETLPSTRIATDFPFLGAPETPEGRTATPQSVYVFMGPPIDVGASSGTSTQMLPAQVLYTGDVDLADDSGHALIPALEPPGHVHNTITGPFGSNGNVSGFINAPGLMMVVNPRGAYTNPPFCHGNAATQGQWMNESDVPARNGHDISIRSLRLRGPRSPPQTYEGDVRKLYDRLIREGADVGAAMVVLFIIFEYGVTVKALMAPIEVPEMVRASGGATRMWELLLETDETTPGRKKYRCLLCPLKKRFEYSDSRDAVRHFNKDHFGFFFPCEYW